MAQPTEVYVDPAIAGNSGTGTIGDPYGDLQYALDTVTRDSTNGNRFNIKAGTDEIISAAISIATYGTPTFSAPLVFQGYTSAAGDGGIGGIDGNNANIACWNQSTVEGVFFVDMHIHNFGTIATLFNFDRFCGMRNCEVNDAGTTTVVNGTNVSNVIFGCHFHDLTGTVLTGSILAFDNYFINDGTRTITRCIYVNNSEIKAIRNFATLDSSSIFCEVNGGTPMIQNNSVLCSSGTGTGILASRGIDLGRGAVIGNIVEGFSGSGGKGYSIAGTASESINVMTNNAAYNNATNYDNAPGTARYAMVADDNETLSTTGFAKSGSNTFANRLTYFAPVDTGNIYNGALNNQDKGAVQHEDPAGGGGGGVRNPLVGPIG